MGLTRRQALRALALPAAAMATPGCARRGEVELAVVWTGAEQQIFDERVLSRYDTHVQLISAGDDIDSLLRVRNRANNRPDAAILPQPHLIWDSEWRDKILTLPPDWVEPAPPRLQELVGPPEAPRGAWVKLAHKSLIWYRQGLFTPDRTPRRWGDFTAKVAELARSGSGPRPLSVGAASGWVLTDWFENMLLAIDPPHYDRLARGEAVWCGQPVEDALTQLGDLWSMHRVFPGGPQRARTTSYDRSVMDVAVSGEAAMVFEADFVRRTAAGFIRPPGVNQSRLNSTNKTGPTLEYFRYPAWQDGAPPLVVGGDVAVAFSEEGQRLVRWLSTGEPDPFQPLREAGGYLSPKLSVGPEEYPDEDTRRLAEQVRVAANEARFDLSDRLGGALGGADGPGLWRILQEFFEAVTESSPRVRDAVDRALDALDTLDQTSCVRRRSR